MNSSQESDFLISISPQEYSKISKLVNDRYGVHLTEKKIALVRGRLTKLIRSKGFQKFAEYWEYLQHDTSGTAMIELMDRLTTNHTYFYRESHSFEFFQETCLPRLAQRLQLGEEIRIWSAGCSSGEEPYTLAMVLDQALNAELLKRIKILATDLSLQVLEQAARGVYPEERLRGIPELWRRRYFSPAAPDLHQISSHIQGMVTFKRLNLMQRPLPFRRKFAAIFCRNVMIYFDQPTKEDLLQQFHQYLEDEGWLFIGHSESLGREQKLFRFIEPAVYQKMSCS